jgi:hypothetical protein
MRGVCISCDAQSHISGTLNTEDMWYNASKNVNRTQLFLFVAVFVVLVLILVVVFLFLYLF